MFTSRSTVYLTFLISIVQGSFFFILRYFSTPVIMESLKKLRLCDVKIVSLKYAKFSSAVRIFLYVLQ